MRTITDVIPSRVWVNKRNGRTASIYGSVPWLSQAEKEEWEMKTRGWTWKLNDGTVGLGRVPAKTREEAVELMERFNSRTY